MAARPIGASFTLDFKPTKTDPSGEWKLHRIFACDPDTGAL